MKFNQWTLGLAALGLVTLTSAARADEKPSAVMTALSSTTLSGYVDTSAQWNLGDGVSHSPGYGFGGASKADGFNLNVVDLNLEKDADAADGWGAGYRVELWLGPDADTLGTHASGVGGAQGDLSIKNAYVDLKAPVGNGIDFKVGVFDTPIGYEVADSPNNPNFTRSYAFSIEPTTHTGVLASYTINEMVSVSAGIANTYGPAINGRATDASGNVRESYKAFMAAATFTASTNWGWIGGSTISACIINGFNGASPAAGTTAVPATATTPATAASNAADQTSYYVGATLNTPITTLKAGASFDYADVRSQGLTGGGNHGYANAFDAYVTWQATEKMSINGRAEYASFGFASPTFAGVSAGTPAIGLASKVFALTGTVQYDLWKNVLTRAEIRWDHALDGRDAFGGTSGLTAAAQAIHGPGTQQDAFEILANIVYKF
jgi:hypothetical protein